MGIALAIGACACGADTGLLEVGDDGGFHDASAGAGDGCTLLSEALHGCGPPLATEVTECERELASLAPATRADVGAIVDCIGSFGRPCSTIDRFHGRCQSQQGRVALELPADTGFAGSRCVTTATCAGPTCTCAVSDGSSRTCSSMGENCCSTIGIPTCFFGSF